MMIGWLPVGKIWDFLFEIMNRTILNTWTGNILHSNDYDSCSLTLLRFDYKTVAHELPDTMVCLFKCVRL